MTSVCCRWLGAGSGTAEVEVLAPCPGCVDPLAIGEGHVFGGRRVDKVKDVDGGVFYTQGMRDWS